MQREQHASNASCHLGMAVLTCQHNRSSHYVQLLCCCMRTQPPHALTSHSLQTQIKEAERTTSKPVCCRQTDGQETRQTTACARGALKLHTQTSGKSRRPAASENHHRTRPHAQPYIPSVLLTFNVRQTCPQNPKTRPTSAPAIVVKIVTPATPAN
jgi:hypothetical protein